MTKHTAHVIFQILIARKIITILLLFNIAFNSKNYLLFLIYNLTQYFVF